MQQSTTTLSLLLRGREVAELLGVSRALAFRWMQNGVLPTVRIPGGRTVRVPREELLAWVKDRTHRSAVEGHGIEK